MYYSEQEIKYIQKPDGGYKEVISVQYADNNDRRITEGTAVYYERCSWSIAFDDIDNNELNNRI